MGHIDDGQLFVPLPLAASSRYLADDIGPVTTNNNNNNNSNNKNIYIYIYIYTNKKY